MIITLNIQPLILIARVIEIFWSAGGSRSLPLFIIALQMPLYNTTELASLVNQTMFFRVALIAILRKVTMSYIAQYFAIIANS